jgi:hypothetical protein
VKNVLKLMFFGRSENKGRETRGDCQTGPKNFKPSSTNSRTRSTSHLTNLQLASHILKGPTDTHRTLTPPDATQKQVMEAAEVLPWVTLGTDPTVFALPSPRDNKRGTHSAVTIGTIGHFCSCLSRTGQRMRSTPHRY